MARGSILLVTMPPYRGGVPAKTAILARHLRDLGWRVAVAHYATLGDDPDLVAPSWRLLSGARPRTRTGTVWDGFECHAVGCWFPELEAPYTSAGPSWRKLVAAHDRHIAVGGNPLVANVLIECGVPHLLWCATTVDEDRRARAREMPPLRRIVDTVAVRPMLLAQQRRVFTSPLTHALGVSRYTCRVLAANGCAPPRWLPIPTDLDLYSPADRPAEAGTIGFAGRLGDPRKRVPLLIDAVALLAQEGVPVKLRLAGECPAALRERAERAGLAGRVDFLGHVADGDLPDFYRGLDVFALPSSQEGLGIVGVEAVASGLPVVSAARNCGPDDYVIDGVTGLFAGDEPRSLADALAAVIGDRERRAAMSRAARALAVEQYGHDAFALRLAASWRQAWGDEP